MKASILKKLIWPILVFLPLLGVFFGAWRRCGRDRQKKAQRAEKRALMMARHTCPEARIVDRSADEFFIKGCGRIWIWKCVNRGGFTCDWQLDWQAGPDD